MRARNRHAGEGHGRHRHGVRGGPGQRRRGAPGRIRGRADGERDCEGRLPRLCDWLQGHRDRARAQACQGRHRHGELGPLRQRSFEN